jgi:membrane protein
MPNQPFLRLIKILSGVPTGAENEFNRLERFAHFWVLVGKSFVRNRCPVRAASLSYATLFALIPMLAVAIGVTSSILKTQGEKEIYAAIDKVVSNIMPPATSKTDSHGSSLRLGPLAIAVTPTNTVVSRAMTNSVANPNADAEMANHPDDSTPVVSINAQKEAAKSIHEFVQNTQSGTLGVIGTLLLVVVAIRMLANIEATFNDIWGVTRGRPWLSRIILYWATITLGPLLLVAAAGLAGSPYLLATKGAITGTVVGGFVFELLPLFVLWVLFTLAYVLVPNTKVNFSAAVIGGIVGGTLWHLNSVFGFVYAKRVVSYSMIYGSLGLVPVFMAGLYFSWLILLFGAQVAYAFQNRQAYLQDKLVENVNQRGREFVALRLMTCIGQRFQNGRPPVTLQNISAELGIPTRLAQQVLQPLLAAHIVAEMSGNEAGYAPARPLDTITAYHVLHALRTGGGQESPLRDGPVRTEVFGEFARIEAAEEQAASAITMLALVSRAPAPLEFPAAQMEKQIPSPPETKVEAAEPTVEPPAKNEPAISPPAGMTTSEPPKTGTVVALPRKFAHPEENSNNPLD